MEYIRTRTISCYLTLVSGFITYFVQSILVLTANYVQFIISIVHVIIKCPQPISSATLFTWTIHTCTHTHTYTHVHTHVHTHATHTFTHAHAHAAVNSSALIQYGAVDRIFSALECYHGNHDLVTAGLWVITNMARIGVHVCVYVCVCVCVCVCKKVFWY